MRITRAMLAKRLDEMQTRADRLIVSLPMSDAETMAKTGAMIHDLMERGLLWVDESDGYGRWYAVNPADPRYKEKPPEGCRLNLAQIANGVASLLNQVEEENGELVVIPDGTE